MIGIQFRLDTLYILNNNICTARISLTEKYIIF